MGQLPTERLNTGFVFDRVGVDYAGPIWIKSGHVRKPIITKVYVTLFVYILKSGASNDNPMAYPVNSYRKKEFKL